MMNVVQDKTGVFGNDATRPGERAEVGNPLENEPFWLANKTPRRRAGPVRTQPTQRRRRTIIFASLVLFWFGTACFGALIPPAAKVEIRTLPARADVQFAGTSTLHDFGGHLPALPFFLTLSNGLWSASADVLAGQMSTANEKRDRKMHQMLGTNAFPKIHGGVVAALIPGAAGTNVTLDLKIRQVNRAVPVRITAWEETAREIKFHADWELSLADFGLQPPSVMGFIRVGDRVKLEANVIAAKPVSPPTPLP